MFIIILLTACCLNSGNQNQGTTKTVTTLPDYALKTPEIKEAYLYARENPDALTGVNCYCGCMQGLTDDRVHYRGVIDCFTEINGSFDQHGSGCPTCINEALRIKSLVAQNKTKEEIKAAIDAEYGHPQGGSGCGIVPNTSAGGRVFMSPNASTGAGCAASPVTTQGTG